MIKIFQKASAEILLSIQSVRSELMITIIRSEMLLMSTHNLYFHGEIKKKRIAWFPLLSGTMALGDYSLSGFTQLAKF